MKTPDKLKILGKFLAAVIHCDYYFKYASFMRVFKNGVVI